MAAKNLSELIEQWLLEFEEAGSYELSRVTYTKEGKERYLRVFVDKLEGDGYGRMGTEDCVKLSRYLSARLDEADPIKDAYFLEVSSPGLDRPLISEKDFQRFKGELIEISLYKAVDGRKFHTGRLIAYSEGNITIVGDDGKERVFNYKDAAKVNLAVTF